MVRNYGRDIIDVSDYDELLEMYASLIVEKNSLFFRKMYFVTQPDMNYLEFLDKYYKRNVQVISEFEKKEIEEAFRGWD